MFSRRTRCQFCGKPGLMQSLMMVTFLSDPKNTDDLASAVEAMTGPEMMGIISDMNKVTNGEWEYCACLPRAWALNQEMWWLG